MKKLVRISVVGVAKNADTERKCREAVQPFINTCDQPIIDVVFAAPADNAIMVRIETDGLTLLRHPRMIEPTLAAELGYLRERIAASNRSVQFHYIPGETEAAINAVRK